jgi:hypothetical protein
MIKKTSDHMLLVVFEKGFGCEDRQWRQQYQYYKNRSKSIQGQENAIHLQKPVRDDRQQQRWPFLLTVRGMTRKRQELRWKLT